jgi:dynein heavy chain
LSRSAEARASAAADEPAAGVREAEGEGDTEERAVEVVDAVADGVAEGVTDGVGEGVADGLVDGVAESAGMAAIGSNGTGRGADPAGEPSCDL